MSEPIELEDLRNSIEEVMAELELHENQRIASLLDGIDDLLAEQSKGATERE